MKLKLIAFALLMALFCTACVSGVSSDPQESPEKPATTYSLTEEQMELLGISQEEFDALSEDEKAEKKAILDEMKAKEEDKKEETQPTPEPEESKEIDPEAEVQKYLENLPALPSGEPEYSYEWSDRLERISDYVITIDPANDTEIYDFMYKLESEYGYMSGGKEAWDPETNTSTYDYRTDTSIIYIDVTPTADGQSKVVIYISYNPYM